MKMKPEDTALIIEGLKSLRYTCERLAFRLHAEMSDAKEYENTIKHIDDLIRRLDG